MILKKIEEEISSAISKYRKEITGRGPIDAISKVIGHTIYVKLNVTFTIHEKNLYKVIKKYNGVDEVCMLYATDYKRIVESILIESGFSIQTDNVLIYPDTDQDFIYAIIVLNKNLEKELIRNT